MEKLFAKYVQILLENCLKIEQNQPLFISANVEALEFVNIVAKTAYKLGIKDIYFDLTDPNLKHEALKNLTIPELKKHQYWNKEKWDEYAKKNAAFLMLVSETPGLMKDIDAEKVSKITVYSYKTRKTFNEYRNKSKLAWCIAAVPTMKWAEQVFPKSKQPLKDLWDAVFDVCCLKEPSPQKYWEKKITKFRKIAQKLNEYNFKKLTYKNSLGTNLSVELPKNHLWACGSEKLTNQKEIIANFPTEEIFTSPNCNSACGIVYSAKPLCYQDVIIDDFWLEFKNGKVVKAFAKKGQETLLELLKSCKNSNMLGEIALVPYNSPISNKNIIFYETLFDENASCHLALGSSFPECLKNGPKMSSEELQKNGLNNCENHVDFMIGTNDLSIIGLTQDDQEIKIFENGNFTKEFK